MLAVHDSLCPRFLLEFSRIFVVLLQLPLPIWVLPRQYRVIRRSGNAPGEFVQVTANEPVIDPEFSIECAITDSHLNSYVVTLGEKSGFQQHIRL